MARNQEKAQSMLNKFLAMKRDRLVKPRDKRPLVADEVHSIQESEKWRQDLLREISRKIVEIQNRTFGFIP